MDLSVGLKPKSNTWAMEHISHFVILLLQFALYSNYLHTHHFPFSLFQYPALLINSSSHLLLQSFALHKCIHLSQ